MTHPDDEISICAWIHRLCRLGIEAHVAWTHSKPHREAEARAVATRLGVSQERLTFFNATDGGTHRELEQLLPKFRSLMRAVKPDRVCCGAFEQGHTDHDTTNYLVNRSFEGTVLEIPFYHTYLTRLQTLNRFSDSRGQEILELDLDEQRLKRAVARQYPSQNIWSVLLWYEISQNVRLRPMQLVKSERMRVQSHFDFSRPNHPPRLAERVSHSSRWIDWSGAVERFEASRVSRVG